MRGTISFDDQRGWHIVTDECGDVWDVVDLDGRHANLVREDGERYHGAEWTADASGSDHGEVWPRRTGDTYDGVDTQYEFDEMRGWKEVVA